MGYSTTIHTIYGWLLPSEPYDKWAEDIDYDMPEGFMLVGVDSDTIAIGVEMFKSDGDNRWEPLSGSATFTSQEARDKLLVWMNTLTGIGLHHANNLFVKGSPKFHTFVNTK